MRKQFRRVQTLPGARHERYVQGDKIAFQQVARSNRDISACKFPLDAFAARGMLLKSLHSKSGGDAAQQLERWRPEHNDSQASCPDIGIRKNDEIPTLQIRRVRIDRLPPTCGQRPS